MKVMQYFIYVVGYYIAWFGAIYFAANNNSIFSAAVPMTINMILLGWQYYIKHTKGMYCLVAIFTILGIAVDSFLMHVGIIFFKANSLDAMLSPFWLWALWINFGLMYYALMQSFFKRYIVLALLALFGFPLAFGMGVYLGAAHLPYGLGSVAVYGFIWAVLFPLVSFIYVHKYGKGGQ